MTTCSPNGCWSRRTRILSTRQGGGASWGDLQLRHGRHAEGGALVREARAMYATQHQEGTDVAEAYCWVLLGRSGLRRGAPAGALELLTTGLRGLARRPDNAPGPAQAQGLLARLQPRPVAERISPVR